MFIYQPIEIRGIGLSRLGAEKPPDFGKGYSSHVAQALAIAKALRLDGAHGDDADHIAKRRLRGIRNDFAFLMDRLHLHMHRHTPRRSAARICT